MKLSVVLTVAPLVALSACASMLDGSSQTIAVKAMSGERDIAAAHCTLSNNKGP